LDALRSVSYCYYDFNAGGGRLNILISEFRITF